MFQERLELLEADLKANVACHGAWVEHKNLLVAWHYRNADRNNHNKDISHVCQPL